MIKLFDKFLTFKPIKKSKILLFDNNYAGLKLSKYSFSLINTKELNILIIIMMFLNLHKLFYLQINLKNFYYYILLKYSNAKILISNNIDGFAFRLKKIKKNVITIVYQHSFAYKFAKKGWQKTFPNSSCDYFISYEKSQTELFSKIIKAKFLEFGSLKNNQIKLKKNKKNKILIISEYREINFEKKSKIKYFPKYSYLHLKAMKLHLQNISRYCKEKKIIPKVALVSHRKDKFSDKKFFKKEISLYKKYLGNFTYENKSSYQLAAESHVSISMNSNLGHELLARGFRVVFTNTKGCLNKAFIPTFFLKKIPFFVLKKQNFSYFEKTLDSIFFMSQKKWRHILKNFNNKIIFDQDNKKLNKLIKRIL